MTEPVLLPDTEDPIPLDQAATLVPGGPKSRQTLWRWCVGGLKGVRLEHLQVGHEICTSREALRRFFRRVTRAAEQERARRTRTDRRKATDEALDELGEAGI